MIDSTPIVVIAGQVGTNFLGTDAFQEVDLVALLSLSRNGVTRFVVQKMWPGQWHVLSMWQRADVRDRSCWILLKNAQVEKTEYAPTKVDYVRSYLPVPEMEPEAIRKAAELINGAERPLVLVGQGVELGEAQQELRAFIEKAGMPAGCTLLGLPHYLRTIR